MRTTASSLLLGTVVTMAIVACGVGSDAAPRVRVDGHRLVRVDEPWLENGCASGCDDAYLEFIDRYRDQGSAATRAGFVDLLAERVPVARPGGDDSASLRQELLQALNIGFLLDEPAADGRLVAAVLGEEERPRHLRRRVLFWSPAVGSFEALMLMPHDTVPHPAVLGLHGHRDDDGVFARDYMGERLAEAGFVVLIPRLRAHDCSLRESRIALALLRRGFTLLGLRAYEALLMLDFLAAEPNVDAARIGLLGHSGGSSVANLVVRLSDDVAALVSDHQVDYLDRCGTLGVHCETVPALSPLAAAINDFETLSIPHLLVPYGFAAAEERTRILELFFEHLGGGARAPTEHAAAVGASKGPDVATALR